MAIFGALGAGFATWASRLPDVSDALQLGPSTMLWLIGAIGVGSVGGFVTAPSLASAFLPRRTAAVGITLFAVGLALAGTGATHGDLPLTLSGLVAMGAGFALGDVSANLIGTSMERLDGSISMPLLHAGFSGGALLGAAGGVLATTVAAPVGWHLAVVGGLLLGVAPATLLLRGVATGPAGHGPRALARPPLDRRVIALAVVAWGAMLAEGAANDWLTYAVVHGHDESPRAGAVLFLLFLVAVTASRLGAGPAAARWGRVRVNGVAALTGVAGVLAFTLGGHPLAMGLGVIGWGLGAAVGLPLAVSAAAERSQSPASRVAVVSSIGYSAFIIGPLVVGLGGSSDIFAGLPFVAVPLALALVAGIALRAPARVTGPAVPAHSR